MKKNYRLYALAHPDIYLKPAMAVLLLTIFVYGSSLAQGNRHGGEKGKGNHKHRNDQSPGGDRRNDMAEDRGGNGGWKKNKDGYNRNRQYDPGNDDRRYNRRNSDMASRRRNDDNDDIRRPRNDDEYSRRRNDNSNRGGYDNRTMNRRRNDDMAGRGNDYRRNIYTIDRPGRRPVYHYDRRPVYNRYDPCWRYGYLPRRNSYFYSIPSSYFSIQFGGFSYRYWDGVFYRPHNNLFTVCAPPIGIYINILPAGYRRIYVRNYPYYYYNGTFYDQRGSNYYVVSPPQGAIVESIPDGYETVVIDGETYYVVDGAQYKPVVIENGEIWYEVIKAN